MSGKLSPMEEQLLGQASTILQAVSDSVGKATDFTVEAAAKAGTFAAQQIPDIAIQYIAYGRTVATAVELIALAVFIFGIWLCLYVGILNKFKIPNRYGWGDGRIVATAAGGVISVVSLVPIIGNLSEFIMVWIAPKVWLIREIVTLVK